MIHILDLAGTWNLTFTDWQRFGRPEQCERETVDSARYIPAQVPGEVHLDAWRAGLIDDPYRGLGSLRARWVEECTWSYRRTIEVPAEALAGRAWLHFDCLDLNAKVTLNGQVVATQMNAFHPCRAEVTGRLKAGANLLVVHLDAGGFAVAEKPVYGYNSSPEQHLHKRHWLRKPQSQYGWDWSARLANIGIQGPARLEWTADTVRLDRLVPLATLSNDLTTGTLRTRIFVEGLGAEPMSAHLRVDLPEAGISAELAIQAKPGLHAYEILLTVPQPRLWWPVGHGTPERYRVEATLSVPGRQVATTSARIGFRSVRFDTAPHPEGGRHHLLEINGRRIFAKGGNLVPADQIIAAITRERYVALVDRALEANFNLLRVWGGGVYEHDDFYDLCDERGILVWQEFIFACSRYPGQDEGFWNSLKVEATHQVRRLASHPSLVLWCGNNEIEWGYHGWGYDKGAVLPDHAIYHHLLPRILAEEDPTRYYQPSSPWTADGSFPNRDDAGDQHPWSVGMFNTDFRDYRKLTCRFANEGGFLGSPSLPTLMSALDERGQPARVGSHVWQAHDNSVESWTNGVTDNILTAWIGRELRGMSPEQACYWLGLVQGEALTAYIDNFRRRMFRQCGAAVFWMYNDCWPTTRGWTIVDHGLRRTPAFQPVRRACAPVHVVVAEEGDAVVAFGINETGQAVEAELRFGRFALGGGFPHDIRSRVRLEAQGVTVLASFPRTAWTDPNGEIAFAELRRDGRLIARNRLILPRFHELAWSGASPRVELRDGMAIFSSEVFAWGLCLDLDGELPLADNFFDLWPGIPYAIPWPHAEAPRIRQLGNLV